MVYVDCVVRAGVGTVDAATVQEFAGTFFETPGPEMVQDPSMPLALYERVTESPGCTRVLSAEMVAVGLLQGAARETLSEQEPPEPVQESV